VVRKEAVAAKLNGCKCGEDFVRATLFAFPPGVISAILWATYTGWLTLRARPATVSRFLRRACSLRMPAWSVVVMTILLCPVTLSAEDDASGNCSGTPKIESANVPGETGKSDKRIFGVLPNLELAQERDQILFLRLSQPELQDHIEKFDGVLDREGAAVVQIGRTFSNPPERERFDRTVAGFVFQEPFQMQIVHLIIQVERRGMTR